MWSGSHRVGYTPLSSVADFRLINTPTEVDHYQIRRVIDIYVATKSEALGGAGKRIRDLIAHTQPIATRASCSMAPWST